MGSSQAQPGRAEPSDQVTAPDRLGPQFQGPFTHVAAHVVVVTLEGHPTQAQPPGERVEFPDAVVAHQVRPSGAPPGPYGLIDQHGHTDDVARPAPPTANARTDTPTRTVGCETRHMARSSRRDDLEAVTLRIPAFRPVGDLPRVGLASLLRIHRIEPSEIGDLASSVQELAVELSDAGSDVVIDYRVSTTEVAIDITGDGRTLRLSAARS